MCEFCVEHGEGKKWYLQAKNYSQELLNEERKHFMIDFLEKVEDLAIKNFSELDKLLVHDPDAFKVMLPTVIEDAKKNHWGQVVPLEEIEQILDMAVNITRLPCVCRSTLRGVYDARFCFGVTTFLQLGSPILELPDYSSDLEKLTKEEAKKAFQKHDRNGLVHTIWTFISPYIGAICNCTVTDCLAMKSRLQMGLPRFFKAEYVAGIDWESCNGCKDCLKNCNFGAISYSPSVQKCYINQFQCYGCGVCRAICSRDAVTLKDRNTIPALAQEW